MYDDGLNEQEDVTSVTLEELEHIRAECKELIETANKAMTMLNSGEFQHIIMQKYFSDEPKRLGTIMASGKLPPKAFDDCVNDLKAIGNLSGFLNDLVQKGQLAQETLLAAEEAYTQSLNQPE